MKAEKAKGIQIVALHERPAYAAICAHWSYLQWYMERNIPFDVNLLAYAERAKGREIPCVFVACVDSFPAGMVSLKENDMRSRTDIGPWLSALYVMPKYRKAGLGGLLVSRVTEHAGVLGLGGVYLFIDRADEAALSSYYEKRGWTYLEDGIDNDGFPAKIYRFGL
jgi:GNAT superfamily N-acetyltransferase